MGWKNRRHLLKSIEKIGNRYILTFGENESTAIAGYINLGAITENYTSDSKDAAVKVINGDQTVIYTIIFENDNVFEKKEIRLQDKLDKRIVFIDSIASDEFEVNYDKINHTVSISNSNGAIPAGARREVQIITDFSNVKPGETIYNTVGKNTAVTKKKYSVVFKKVNSATGEALENATFRVLDEKQSEILGNIFTDNNGIGRFKLPVGGIYYLQEVNAPEGYKLNEKPYEYIKLNFNEYYF